VQSLPQYYKYYRICNLLKAVPEENHTMSAEIQNITTMKVPYQWVPGKATDETDPTGVYSPLKDLIGNSKPTPLRVAFHIGNQKTYFQTHSASELNETEKKFQSILYSHLPGEAKSWLKQQHQAQPKVVA